MDDRGHRQPPSHLPQQPPQPSSQLPFQPPQQPPQNMDPNLLHNLASFLQHNNTPFNPFFNPYYLQNPNLHNPNNFPNQNPTLNSQFQNPMLQEHNIFPPGVPNPNFSSPIQPNFVSQKNEKRQNDFGQNRRHDVNTDQQQLPNCAPLSRGVGNIKFPVHQKIVARSDHKASLEKVDAAVCSARRELIAATENVSVWKISQLTLVKLQAESWDSLGFKLQEVPSLNRLILTEGKINAFIHCYVAVQRITSLFDLQVAICKNEGIETFEELELGPFLQHPLVVHYFGVYKDVTEVYKITTEQIMLYLSELFYSGRRKKFNTNEFLDFVAKKCQVTSWQQLGVRIQSLGMHIELLREVKTSRDLVWNKCMDTVKERCGKLKKKRPLFSVEKKQLDDRFGAITQRVASFASVNKDFSGKHIRFSASSSDEENSASDSSDREEERTDYGVNQYQLSSAKRKSGEKVSACPYPSVAEERKRLGLKGETKEYSSPSRQLLSSSQTGGTRKKKRKLDRQSKEEALKKSYLFQPTGTEDKLDETNVDNSDLFSIRMFINTWKEACRELPAEEVFMKMLEFYSTRQKNQVKLAFSTYPLLGLLNVAITSIKNGMWDSMYDTLRFMDELEQANPRDDEHTEYESIDVEPIKKDSSLLNKAPGKPDSHVEAEDIVGKAFEYLAERAMLYSGNSLPDRLLRFGEQFSNCETWLAQQFSVAEFKLLGHGDFWSFVGKHDSIIPKELLQCLEREAQVPESIEAYMLKQQLEILLSQASSSLWEDDDHVTKEKISELLVTQFPFISFKINGSDRVQPLLDAEKQHRTSITSKCVVFSATLLGASNYTNTVCSKEVDVLDNYGLAADVAQIGGKLGSVTSKKAINVLLKAPFLSDLNSWSHWDLLYAPSLGPLLQWLLTEVNAKDLLCLLTRDGSIIRINHSSSQDLLFQAILQESPFQIAVHLLSLFSMHGGKKHLPLSLLKCQARQAFEVVMGSSILNKGVNDSKIETTSRELTCEKSSGCDWIAHSQKSLGLVNGAIAHVSRIFIDCLGFLPSEFRCFAADILLSGLQSVVKDFPSAVLLQCKRIEERLMVHEVGLSLGIIDWIHDHHVLCPITTCDSSMSIGSLPFISADLDVQPHGIQCPPAMISSPPAKTEECKVHSDINTLVCYPKTGGSGIIMTQHPKKDTNVSMEAALVIESIRREEFGLDPNMSDIEGEMMKKQHARLGRALHCLSQELYSQDSHFLLELVQNADDNVYPENVEPTVTFILQHTGIVVLNNERGFTAQNIKALCDVGKSTKKGSSAGYIGQKGIGFKSVFRVTDAPEIHSNGYHIKFDITDGQIGFVLPTIVPPCNIETLKQFASESDIQKKEDGWNTCIVLPFKSKFQDGSAMGSILSMFSDVHPSLLLFLHRLQCIKLRNMVSDTLVVMRKEILGDGIVRVSHGDEKMIWFVASNKLYPKVIRPNVEMTEISIALTLKETENGDYEPFLDQQPVFAFLPLRTYGLKFILQADFVLPSSREEVDGDNPWNQWLLSEFPGLFVNAQKAFCTLPCFQSNPARAVTFYMSFVPFMGEVHGFFSGLPRLIISKLRQSNCLLQEGCKDKWVPPCQVLRGWNEQSRMLLSDTLLFEHLGLGFLNKDICLPDSLARALGVAEYDSKILIQFITSLGCTKDGIKSMGLGWLVNWLNELYNMYHSCTPHLRNSGLAHELVNSLRGVPFVPLSDGTYSSVNEGTIWFNADNVIASTNSELGNSTFPHLYATLRIVSPDLFCEASNDTYLINNCTQMLQLIGVQKLSDHELIKAHILPSISKGKSSKEDQHIMIEYMAFVMHHLQSTCVDCHVESEHIISELCCKAPILTNCGYKQPTEVSIHFGKDFGNSIDVNKLIGSLEYKWHEVDMAYLKHPVTASLSSRGWMKWREFLQRLGVTDFMRVVGVEKSTAELPSVVNQKMCNRQLISPGAVLKDWESPELAHMLYLVSKDGSLEQCKYLLEVLDTLWDDHFSDKAFWCCSSKTGVNNIFFKSSFMNDLTESKWVASSLDKELHYPRELYYDCDAVRSVLGCQAPYAVPKINSSKLLSEIGFKTQVTLDDALVVLKIWRSLESPFKASLVQMSKFYNFIWKEMAKSREQVLDTLCSGPFIFVPYSTVKFHEDIVPGVLLSPEDVYWLDSTGALDSCKDADFSSLATNTPFSKTLSTAYTGLRGFFVKECGVHETPTFHQYLQILQQLSTKSSPRDVANVVFQVLLKWSDGLRCGALKSDDVNYLKDRLLLSDFTVLPAMQDKWISLHSSFGLVCWCDDNKLKKEFKQLENVEFLYFGELSNDEEKMLQTKVSVLLKNLNIPALSEVVFREAIHYGTADCGFKSSMVAWVLPFAQRYVYNLHSDKYNQFQLSGLSVLDRLRIVVVEDLYSRNVIKRSNCASNRSKRNSLLQGDILYTTRESDSHSMFLELYRLFFNGRPDLHLANFLCMITTKAESDLTEDDIESFILNSQNMAKLPEEESIWSIPPCSSLQKGEVLLVNSSPMNMGYPISAKSKKNLESSNWPPANWNTAPGFHHSLVSGMRTQATNTDQIGELYEISLNDKPELMWVEANDGTRRTEEGGIITPDQTFFLPPEDQARYNHLDDACDPTNIIVESLIPEEILSKSGGRRDKLVLNTPGSQKARLTGKVGEHVAYQYFCGKFGEDNVNWVNEDSETGLPYDIVVEKEEEGKEYIEVKATRYANKDWFVITTREWQFAVEKGDSFSIAYVILSEQDTAKITIYKNPLKLCQLGKLQLAVTTPRYYQEQIGTQ